MIRSFCCGGCGRSPFVRIGDDDGGDDVGDDAGAAEQAEKIGGWRIVKTIGSRIFKLETYHSFAAESATGVVIAGASFFGAPVMRT